MRADGTTHVYRFRPDALRELKGCIAPVSVVTGEGQGERSRAALALLNEKLFAALRQFEPVFLTIQSKKV